MTTCPSELELTVAISEGARPEIAAHLATCEACRAQVARLERARTLARKVDVSIPSPAHCDGVRTALLAAASAGKQSTRRRYGVFVGTAIALAAAALALVIGRPSSAGVEPHRHASVRAEGPALMAQLWWTPDELVVLYDGTIEVDVAPLHSGERFRVLVGEAEVEVHGTAFSVTARAGELIDVEVHHGVVEVRERETRRVLTGGQAWRSVLATKPPPTLAPLIAPPPVGPTTSNTTATAPSTRRSTAIPEANTRPIPRPVLADKPTKSVEPIKVRRLPEEIAYDDAWAAMRDGRFPKAAGGFARVMLLDPTGALAEDSGFWYAVALARSGQTALAATAFRDFLVAHPHSRRTGEASAMLGWILVDAGDLGEAERRFRAAISDPSSLIRASAEAGLATIGKLRQP